MKKRCRRDWIVPNATLFIAYLLESSVLNSCRSTRTMNIEF